MEGKAIDSVILHDCIALVFGEGCALETGRVTPCTQIKSPEVVLSLFVSASSSL